MSDDFNIFFKEKPSLILLNLNKDTDNIEKSISSLSKNTNCVFCHTTNIIISFQKNNIVTFKKIGRSKIITLTEKGKKLATLLEEMLNVSGELELVKPIPKQISTEVKGGKKKNGI